MDALPKDALIEDRCGGAAIAVHLTVQQQRTPSQFLRDPKPILHVKLTLPSRHA
jgi:hypothetical protein